MLNNLEVFNDIVSKILLLDKKNINNKLSRKDVEEWDSLSHLVLLSECEKAFDFTFSDEDIVEIQTIGDLKNIIRNNAVLI